MPLLIETQAGDVGGSITEAMNRQAAQASPMNMPAYTPHSSVTLPNSMAATARQAFDTTRQQNAIASQVQQQLSDTAMLRNAQRLQDAAMQIERRMNQTGYSGLDNIGNFALRQQANALRQQGAVPVFADGVYRGVRHKGLFGGEVYSGEQAYNPFADRFATEDDNRRQVVLPETDVATGAKRCADGYVFDEQLQACRLAVTLPNQPEPVQTSSYDFYEQPYEDIGLLGNYGGNLFYG